MQVSQMGGASEAAYQMVRRRLCPKVELDGIPEFVAQGPECVLSRLCPKKYVYVCAPKKYD